LLDDTVFVSLSILIFLLFSIWLEFVTSLKKKKINTLIAVYAVCHTSQYYLQFSMPGIYV